ncbi:MAG: helix-turn-helix domain-containing protein [Bacillota bacterium]|jgi:AcrR family transcriptional regulator|nr:helix-turn-helix domain-containing protein [Bacillota bacterium]NLL26509.1 helix-turn-helix transcriptional regulator [Erysipelotrichia bacterium]
MAQVLKEAVKDKIIAAAKEEFLKKGYKEASMRAIARKSKMTVGNLYRYFSSKEEMIIHIVSPPMLLLDKLLKKITGNKLTFYSEYIDLSGENLSDLKEKINIFVEGMVEIYQQHKVEFNVLLMHSELNDEITKWCAKLIKHLLTSRNNIKEYEEEALMLSQSYAVGLFSGLKEIFAISELNTERLINVTKLYLESCLSMFQFDFKKSLGE